MFEGLMKLGKLPKQTTAETKKTNVTLDAAQNDDEPDNSKAIFQDQAIASEALGYVAEWVETTDEDLDEGEGLGDRLYAMMIALVDDTKDGEISDDEAAVINVGLNAVCDYMISKGVSEENALALLQDFDNELAKNIHEFLLDKLPEGDDALFEEMDELVFSQADNEPVLDSALDGLEGLTLDATYRKVFAVRNGKKLRIKKRVAGKVRLSAKQRQAIRKAQRRANTGAAKMRRLRSFKMRRRMGM